MNEKFQELYERLDNEMLAIQRSGLSEQEKTEACFKGCLDYLPLLKEVIQHNPFACDREEIDFFKYIKPQFTGQLEFYTQVYQYQLFCPVSDPVQAVQFRAKELRRIERFREMHAEFIRYYTSGATSRDAVFFLRRYYEEPVVPCTKVFDIDPEMSSSYDWILTQLVGYGLYEQFLGERARVCDFDSQ
jgi:hypothetical protein